MNAVLQLANVSKVYGSGHTAVKAVDSADLAVGPGEIVLIMGPSGSGKTTLLSIAGCLLKPSAGTVSMDGLSVSSLDERRLPGIRL
ncbi:MAG: ATP-binding cassette domain-containing protein, partial [Actinomycetota bacterium]|nr:ATP-binding cassette domain-containing protein [Actinomycetota bacterium]